MPTVVVTGASQGIGRAIAEAFARDYEDARVALLARSEDKLHAVAEVIRSHGGEALVVPCDVTDDDAVARAADAVHDAFGTAGVLVNNAGLFQPGDLLDLTADSFRQQVAVNLTSAFVVTKAFLAPMLEAERGHVFFMASIASLKAYPGGAAYAAAKHGLRGLARALRSETYDKGLRVTTLFPGATRTASWDGTDLPDERFMPPEDIAAAVLDAYRLSDRTVLEEVVLRPQQGDI